MDILEKHKDNPFALLLGLATGCFMGGIPLYFAYRWFAYNFNLPTMTYLEMVCMFASLQPLGRVVQQIIHNK